MTQSGTSSSLSETLGAAQEAMAAKASEALGALERSAPGAPNISADERQLSVLGGGALAVYGMGRRSPLLTLLGGYLAYRGLSGHCALYEALGMDTAHPEQPRKPLPRKQDVVMEASEDSFPASDPPAWGESGVKPLKP